MILFLIYWSCVYSHSEGSSKRLETSFESGVSAHSATVAEAKLLTSGGVEQQQQQQHLINFDSSIQLLGEEVCPVCSDKISGYHYGLQTCESCKGSHWHIVAVSLLNDLCGCYICFFSKEFD